MIETNLENSYDLSVFRIKKLSNDYVLVITIDKDRHSSSCQLHRQELEHLINSLNFILEEMTK